MNWIKKLQNLQNRKSLVVAGVISGTSADGIDVALSKFSGPPEELQDARCVFSRTYPYSPEIQNKIRGEKNPSLETISQLHVAIGKAFGEALLQAEKDSGISYELIGSHGQTVYHHSGLSKEKTTLQLGCGDVIARETGRPCVHDFRAKDIASGGEGAPLTPATDFFLFRPKETRRAILNLGGIANLTIFGDSLKNTIGFDTGPANAPLDRLVRRFTDNAQQFDTDGRIADSAAVDEKLLQKLLEEDAFISKPPPKSAGFENYGDSFVDKVIAAHGGTIDASLIATTTRYIAISISQAIKRFSPHEIDELVVAGGGAKNRSILNGLALHLPGVAIKTFDEIGVAASAREAMAFGFLSYLFLHSYALQLSSITGAQQESILGKLSVP